MSTTYTEKCTDFDRCDNECKSQGSVIEKIENTIIEYNTYNARYYAKKEEVL